jgi:hypothetical protein
MYQTGEIMTNFELKTVEFGKCSFDKKALNQITQYIQLEFAFASMDENNKVTVLTQPAYCRDYLHDVIRVCVNKDEHEKGMDAYNMTYSPVRNGCINLKKTMLYIRINRREDTEESLTNDIRRSLSVINVLEKQMRQIKTDAYRVINGPDKYAFMLIGPNTWMKAPWLMSLYTLVIRLGFRGIECNTLEELDHILKNVTRLGNNDNDYDYIRAVGHYIVKMVMNIPSMKCIGYHKCYCEGTMDTNFHNRMGIMSFLRGCTPNESVNRMAKQLFPDAAVHCNAVL